MCAHTYVFMYVCNPHPHPPWALIHVGGDVKEMGGIWWSVFICSISLFFLRGTRAMLETLHEGWGYILLLPLSSLSPQPPRPNSSFSHRFPAPRKDSIEERQCLVDVISHNPARCKWTTDQPREIKPDQPVTDVSHNIQSRCANAYGLKMNIA